MCRGDENAGYYCLLIAIFCGLGAADAQKLYEYGPEHPICRKIRQKKIRMPETGCSGKTDRGQLMRKFLREGYTWDAVAEAFGCYPSTVRRKIKKTGERGNAAVTEETNREKGEEVNGRPESVIRDLQ